MKKINLFLILIITVILSLIILVSCKPPEPEKPKFYLAFRSFFDMTPIAGHNDVTFYICADIGDALMIPGEEEYEGWYVFAPSHFCLVFCENTKSDGVEVADWGYPGIYDWGIKVDADGDGYGEIKWIDQIKPDDGGLKQNRYEFEEGKTYNIVLDTEGKTSITVSD